LVETKEARIVSFLANVYLYKIAEIKKEEESMLLLKNKIFSNPFILLFSEYKILEYESTMSNKYVIHYYLDKIEVFLNDKIFAQITP